MKFSVSSKALHAAASAVNKVINSKNAITILNNFYISLEENRVILRGSDVENALTAFVPVGNAEGVGSFCVDAKRFTDLLKEIPEQGIEVKVDDNYNVEVKYSSGVYNFAALPGEQYPEYKRDEDDTDEPVAFTLKSTQIVRGIENTLFAASTDDYRPMMMGIYMDVKADGVTYVATDTRKLVKFVDRSSAPGVTVARILPPKPAGILKSVFGADEDVNIYFTSKSATFENENIQFNCRFIQATFPPYDRVIPRNNNLILSADRMSLLTAVRRVGVFVDPNYGLEKLLITPDNIVIKSEDNNLMNSAREEVSASFTGEKLIIGFSAPYLTEILNIIKTQDVTILLSDPGRPGIFRPSEDEADTELVMLLMPMTVGEF
ncbi:MAG: DNA polymerase III subunit beta [Muribaculaceae bacterium]|nr:DNA polymerase III subunit beta [Muribaculaceae bacterium]